MQNILNESQMGRIHAAIVDAYPQHEPLRIIDATDSRVVVSAFNRAIGKQKVFHVLKKQGNDWKHIGVEKSAYLAKLVREDTLLGRIQRILSEIAVPKNKHGYRANFPVIKGKWRLQPKKPKGPGNRRKPQKYRSLGQRKRMKHGMNKNIARLMRRQHKL